LRFSHLPIRRPGAIASATNVGEVSGTRSPAAVFYVDAAVAVLQIATEFVYFN